MQHPHKKTFTLTQQTLTGLVMVGSLAAQPAAADNTAQAKRTQQAFHISGGTLSHALSQFAGSAGIVLSADARLTDGKASQGLNGQFSVAEGLSALLAGSGLTYQYTANGSVLVAQAPKPVENLNQADPTTLPAVKVSGKSISNSDKESNELIAVTGYNPLKAETGTKTDVKLFDTPMAVQVVPKAVIDDQQAIGLSNAVKNVSGVQQNFGFGFNDNESLIIRGFDTSLEKAGASLILRDGFFTFGVPISLANIDRVEVLKGPAAMLYGKLEPGGLVNVVSKRPQSKPSYSLQQQFGSFDTYRTLLDATGPIKKDGSVSYRFDYEHLDAGSFRNFVHNKRDFIAPTVTWNISDDTQVDFEFVYQNLESIRDHGIPYGLWKKGLIKGNLSNDLFLAEPTDYYNQEYVQGGMSLKHRINKDWQINGKFTIAGSDISETQTFGKPKINGNEMARGLYATDDKTSTDFETINLIGHFDTWNLQHTLLIGGDHFNYNTDSATFCCDTAPAINLFNPQYGFNGFTLPSVVNAPRYLRERNYEWYGVYIQDQIKFGEKWQLLLGGRYDNTEFQQNEVSSSRTIKNDNFSPRAGLMYHPLPWLGLYASYVQGTNSFNNGFTASGAALNPEQSRQYEVGLKGEWLDGRLSAGLAVFELTKKNISIPDPDTALALQGFKQAIGEVRSQGIEFDLRGKLTDYWNVIGNYAFTNVDITKDSDTNGGIGNQGKRFANVPSHSGSIWTTYDFSGFGARGFSSGIGVFLASDRAGNITNTFDMPGYARLDAMLKYQRKVGPSNVTFQFNIENLTDKDYLASSNGTNEHQVIPGAPRTFLGSVKVEF